MSEFGSEHRGRPAMGRRSFLQVGYSGLLGLGLPGLLAAREAKMPGATTGRARSVIVILLSGGLGQHDSFDMKPEAPEGIRGEFKPIDTTVPGIRICEHLPRLAARAGKLAIVRSMSHPEGNHLLAVHRVLTGHASNPRGATDLDRVASRDDFPCYAAVFDLVRRRSDGVPNGVALPTRLVEGPLTWPGQDAGFLGPRHDPWQLRLDPGHPEARDDSLALPAGLDPARLHRRRHLLSQTAEPSSSDPFIDQQDAAIALLCNGKVGQALDHRARRPPPGRSIRISRSAGRCCWRGGWSRSVCQSCRPRWGSCRPGTRTSPTSLGFATVCCRHSIRPCRPCSTISRFAACWTKRWS